MRKLLPVTALAAVAALSLAGCTGGSDSPSATDDGTITVWTTEDVADRVDAQQAILDEWSKTSGVDVKVVAVSQDQLTTVLTSSAASGDLPDVIAALNLNSVNQLYTDDLLDTDAAAEVVDALGADTFSERALSLTKDGDTQLSVPSDAWAQLLFYRTDLFESAGLEPPTTYDAIRKAAETLNTDGVAGIVAATAPNDSFTQQTFEEFALANGCELVNNDGDITLDSPECINTFQFYADMITDTSVAGNQDADTTRATYFAGDAAMMVWSSFLLDELAGLRADALPTCEQCADDPGFLAANTGVVSAIEGPDGSEPQSFGEIVSWTILRDANPKTKDLVEWAMDQGYEDWLGIAPEGKVPVRLGTADDPEKFSTAWQSLEAGVDTKALLSDVYPPEILDAVVNSPSTFSRWGFPQGQGQLASAVAGQFVVPQALATMLDSGTSAEDAAKQAQEQANGIKEDLGY